MVYVLIVVCNMSTHVVTYSGKDKIPDSIFPFDRSAFSSIDAHCLFDFGAKTTLVRLGSMNASQKLLFKQ